MPFSPAAGQVATATAGAVRGRDWRNQETSHGLPAGPSSKIPSPSAADGRLSAGVRDGPKLWDPQTETELLTVPHDGVISALAFSADGKWLASAGYDRTVKLWNATTGELFHELLHHGNQVECVTISPDG